MNIEIEKIKSIMQYLATNVSDLYLTKSLKLFYYLDFISVLERGEPITGVTYHHLPYGPVPSFIKDELGLLNSDFRTEEKNIIKDSGEDLPKSVFLGVVELDPTPSGTLVNSSEDPDLSHLSKYEIDLLEDIVNDLGSLTARDLVNRTHSEIPYIQTPAGNIIQYKLAFYLNRNEILPNRNFQFDKELSQSYFFERQ